MLIVLDTPEDLAWAKDAHAIPQATKFAVLHGSQDEPTKIECWNNPPLFEPPDVTVHYPEYAFEQELVSTFIPDGEE